MSGGIKLLKYFFSYSQPRCVFGEKFPNYITFLFLLLPLYLVVAPDVRPSGGVGLTSDA